MSNLIKRVNQIEWHRNGICGVGFYAILFETTDNELMVASLYEDTGYCSVLRVDDLSDVDKGVTFGINSWRGDNYETELREAVKRQKSTNRIGIFSIPVI